MVEEGWEGVCVVDGWDAGLRRSCDDCGGVGRDVGTRCGVARVWAMPRHNSSTSLQKKHGHRLTRCVSRCAVLPWRRRILCV